VPASGNRAIGAGGRDGKQGGDMTGFSSGALFALAQVVAIDVTLAGDNAVVVGMAVAGLPKHQRTRAIAVGVLAAAVIRIALSVVAVQLLAILGLTLAGGLLLLWVCWKMYRELRLAGAHAATGHTPHKTLRQAILQITLADLSMSLDNVLAVAGAARDHIWVMVLGLALSVVLMGTAASLLARLLNRYRWIAWVGLGIVAFVSANMIWHGGLQVAPFLQPLVRQWM
jgi:YjbE family integral membrane protein